MVPTTKNVVANAHDNQWTRFNWEIIQDCALTHRCSFAKSEREMCQPETTSVGPKGKDETEKFFKNMNLDYALVY